MHRNVDAGLFSEEYGKVALPCGQTLHADDSIASCVCDAAGRVIDAGVTRVRPDASHPAVAAFLRNEPLRWSHSDKNLAGLCTVSVERTASGCLATGRIVDERGDGGDTFDFSRVIGCNRVVKYCGANWPCHCVASDAGTHDASR